MKFTHAVAFGSALFVTAAPLAASPLPSPSPASEKPTRAIAIVINGEPLGAETAPIVVDGHVLVPLRVVFNALGIAIERSGATISARLPSGSVSVTVDSRRALINGEPVMLDSRVTDINGTTFVPLRFIAQALGARARYDQFGAKVDIVSGYIGRNESAEKTTSSGGSLVQGVVSAVDANSQPASLTLVRSGQSRTIAITSNAPVYIEDVIVHSQVKGTLSDVHVGDALSALLTRDGRVLELHALYKSAAGLVSAISPTAFVMANGRVVMPAKATDITVNGAPAKIGDLLVGDFVTVRSNPETGELRQVIAARTVAPGTAPPSPTDVVISSFAITASRALRVGESFDAVLQGTPAGKATFDIGEFLTGIAMKEEGPGTYRGRFTIPERFNVTRVPVYGHLSVGGSNSPRAEAKTQLSAATTPPQVTEVAPPPGQTVNNARPSIYATFAAPTEIPINVSSIVLSVNGHDVTSSATRTNTFVTYSPSIDYPDGEVKITVRVSDSAGNTATHNWAFFIKR